MSDDGWYGSEPAPGAPGSAGYGRRQGAARAGAGGEPREPRGYDPYGQSGQYGGYEQQQSQGSYESAPGSGSYGTDAYGNQSYSQASYGTESYSADSYSADSYSTDSYGSAAGQGGRGQQSQAQSQSQAQYGQQQYAEQPGQSYYEQPQAYSPAPAQAPQSARQDPYQPYQQPGDQEAYAQRRSASPSAGADPYQADPNPQDPYAASPQPRSQRQAGRSRGAAPQDPYASGDYPAQSGDQRQQPGAYPAGYATGGARGRVQNPAAGGRHDSGYDFDGAGYPSASLSSSSGQPGYRDENSYPGSDPASFAPGDAGYPASDPGAGAAKGGGRRRRAAPTAPPAPPPGVRDEQDEFDDYSLPPRRGGGRQRGEDHDGYGRDRAFDEPSDSRTRTGSRSGGLPSDDDDEDRFKFIGDGEDGDGENAKPRKGKQKRGRNCLAVFIAFSVVAGGLGYGGYEAYNWYKARTAAPADFSSKVGNGTRIDVTIPTGSGGSDIGAILYQKHVVASEKAFVNACNANPQCSSIEAGTYLLPEGINSATAVTQLLNPANLDGKTQLIVYSGERAADVFTALEQKTGWSAAQIQSAVGSGQIDLPSWDTGQAGANFPYAHIEGFIASETYTLTGFKDPTALLKKMVDDQLAMFTQQGLPQKAQALKLSEYQALIVASLARAEAGNNPADLNKIAEVIYNRLGDTQAGFNHLGFDTSTLYGMGNTTTVPNNTDKTNPYNTSVYGITGLPPSPIDNPDQVALAAVLSPATGTYLYFCATPDGIQYASNNQQWQQLGQQYPGDCGSG